MQNHVAEMTVVDGGHPPADLEVERRVAHASIRDWMAGTRIPRTGTFSLLQIRLLLCTTLSVAECKG